jgi:hypothetical protein
MVFLKMNTMFFFKLTLLLVCSFNFDLSTSNFHLNNKNSYLLSFSFNFSPVYLSVVELQLTPDRIPDDLVLVHLRVVIEGNLFTKELEAKPSLRFTYAWNKRNVYKQKVYGETTAKS